MGLETGFTAFGRRSTVDIQYNPPKDTAMIKCAIRQGKTKLSAMFSFDSFKQDTLKNHAERYEFDAKLSSTESLKLAFDASSKAGKIKVTRKLDPKNRVDAEYNYNNTNSKYVALTLKHQYSKTHTFGVTTNYGAKKFRVEWDCKTDNGPWTVSTNFPFNSRLVICFIITSLIFFILNLSILTTYLYPSILLFSNEFSPLTGDWQIKRRFEF